MANSKLVGKKRSIIYSVVMNEASYRTYFQTKQLSVGQHGEFK